MNDTWKVWDEICTLNRKEINRGGNGNISRNVLLEGPIMGAIIIEPGSLSFDYPEMYGYRVVHRTLEEYIQAQSKPSWHHWLNYETEELNRNGLVNLYYEAITQFISKRKQFGAYSDEDIAVYEQLLVKADRIATEEVDRIMELSDETEKKSRLISLKNALDFSEKRITDSDCYGYRQMLESILSSV
jgi:hypothetical protein